MLQQGTGSAPPRAGRLAPDSTRQLCRVLTILREEVGMDLAYLTEFVGDQQVVRLVVGDPSPFGLSAGTEVPLAGSFCQMVVDGRLDRVVPDTSEEPRVADLPVTRRANLGSYVGVPVHRPDGRLYGTLCCAAETPIPALADRETGFLSVLARIVADVLVEEEARSALEDALASRDQDLISVNVRLAASHQEMVRRLSMAVEYRDDATGAHVHRVARLSRRLAAAAGLSPTECELVGEAAALHDLGKVAVPDHVLLKPGPLTAAERAMVCEHARIGHDLLDGSDSPVLQMAATIAWTHHERFDGTGYPRGLAGQEIPLPGRIVAIVDVHDALSSDRAYRPPMPPDEVRRLLEDGAGSQFDPWLLELFVRRVLPEPASRWQKR